MRRACNRNEIEQENPILENPAKNIGGSKGNAPPRRDGLRGSYSAQTNLGGIFAAPSSLLFPTKARSLRSLPPLRDPIFQAARFASKKAILGTSHQATLA